MDVKEIRPIGMIRTDYKEKFGIPRQSGRVPSASGTIELYPPYNTPAAVKGLELFTHIWLIFDFSECRCEEFSPTVRPPRLGGNTRVGVFATRSPFRPNGLGLSCVRLDGVLPNGNIAVSGVDLLDKTPIYDIKPYIPYADRIDNAGDGYTAESKSHHLKISDGEELLKGLPEELIPTVTDSLCEDPRPSYQDDPGRIYSMRFSEFDIRFKVCGDEITITAVDRV